MDPGQKFLTRVGSAIHGLDLNLENFPQKCQIFNFFPFGNKNLFGWVKKYPGQRQFGLF